MGVDCRNYTKARRHPKVLGRLPGGKPMPVPITMPQLAVLAVMFIVVALILWLTPLIEMGPFATVIVAATAVVVPFLAIRKWRPDSRGPFAQLRALTLDRLSDYLEARR